MSFHIGELLEEPGEVRGHWRIPNFLSVPEGLDKCIWSPKFFFFDSCWCLKICPNRETQYKSTGSIGLYLHKINCGYAKKVIFSIGVKNWEGKIERVQNTEWDFPPEPRGYGYSKFIPIWYLRFKKKELLPSGALTITYTIKSKNEGPLEGSLCGRLWNVSKRLRNFLSTQKRTDVTLKLKDEQISAHKTILESQSPVFERMFDIDMLENKTGEVTIEDASADAFKVALNYVYGGELLGLTSENATEVYRVAHMYEMEGLRKLCIRIMRDTLSLETVCDVISLAQLYQERTLMDYAKEYFVQNKTEIFKSEKWKTFKSDHPAIEFEIMECALAEKRVMSMEIGELLEEPGEVRGQWRIPNFLSLLLEVDKSYWSPKFFFFDSFWCLEICPNEENDYKSLGPIGLYLHKINCGNHKKVIFSFGVKNWVGKIERVQNEEWDFPPESQGYGFPIFLQKWDLLRYQKEALLPSDALTITYTIESKNEGPFEGSLCGRLWNVSKSMSNILSTQKRTDVILKLKDGQISAHKTILESQSAVFERMFGIDMLESKTREVTIEDASADTFKIVVNYIYGGEPQGITSENATEVYRVSHKYEMEGLRKVCIRIMRDTLSLETVCDVISLADLYQETTLMEYAKEYLVQNKTEIFKSEKWKTFKIDHPAIGFEIMECALRGDEKKGLRDFIYDLFRFFSDFFTMILT